ncbi:helix-hairpin-helix domain-containing protein [Macrococcus lamae]|uniref:ComEA protein n=1 Tax=Macrococcus lamae TaxID=198484 RepID=A0A4R6BXU9_9STAP|nr:helix-hairpin-helix domain-containing protein [Macrococcus lamae]TDM13088.1 comEA protein [Macrococcus lamae]
MINMNDWLQKHKSKLGIAILIVIGAFLIFNFINSKPHEEKNLDQMMATNAKPLKSIEPVHDKTDNEPIMVDVKGAVKYSGVYPAKKTQRVNDVIKLAVPLENADIQAVNLAMTLTDQMVIYVPFEGEAAENKFEMYQQSAVGSSNQQNTVNINHASEGELQEIPGIGPKKAQDIIMYREQHGDFKSKEEMKEIKGIGDKTYMTLEPFIEL